MWEKLLVRSLVHRIEDEISSPIPSQKPFKQSLLTLPESDEYSKQTSSTLSLVSKDLMDKELEAPHCEYASDTSTKKRSHSYDCSRQPCINTATKAYPL